MANSDYGAIPLTLAESTSEALNTKLGVITGFKPSEWPAAIASIPTGGGGIQIEQVLTDGRISNRDYGTVNLDKNILGYDWAVVRVKKSGQTSTALFDLSQLDGTNYIQYKYQDLAVFVTVQLSDSTLKCYDYGGAWDIIDADVSVFNGTLFEN